MRSDPSTTENCRPPSVKSGQGLLTVPTSPSIRGDRPSSRSTRMLRLVGARPLMTPGALRRRLAVAVTGVLAGDLAGIGAAFVVVGNGGAANWICAIAAVAGLISIGSYRLRCTLSALDEAPRLAGAVGVAALAAAPFSLHNSSVLLQAAASVVSVVLIRTVSYAGVRTWRRNVSLSRQVPARHGCQ